MLLWHAAPHGPCQLVLEQHQRSTSRRLPHQATKGHSIINDTIETQDENIGVVCCRNEQKYSDQTLPTTEPQIWVAEGHSKDMPGPLLSQTHTWRKMIK